MNLQPIKKRNQRMTRRESRTVIIFWLTAILLVVGGVAMGWTVEDCIEVNWDHPDCDQYPTTTVYVTTTQPEVTTTTAQETTTTVADTTTTTPNETTTTQPPFDPTTTTIPFDSVPDTIPTEIGTPLTVEAPEVVTVETLPMTGPDGPDPKVLALVSSLLLLAGVGVLALDRRTG